MDGRQAVLPGRRLPDPSTQSSSPVVEHLMDASRVVRGQVALQHRRLNALDVVRDAIDAARPKSG